MLVSLDRVGFSRLGQTLRSALRRFVRGMTFPIQLVRVSPTDVVAHWLGIDSIAWCESLSGGSQMQAVRAKM